MQPPATLPKKPHCSHGVLKPIFANAGENQGEDVHGASGAGASTREERACTPPLAALAAGRTGAGQWRPARRFHLQRQLQRLLLVQLGARVEQQLHLASAGRLPRRGQLCLDGRDLRDELLLRCLQLGALVCGVGRLSQAGQPRELRAGALGLCCSRARRTRPARHHAAPPRVARSKPPALWSRWRAPEPGTHGGKRRCKTRPESPPAPRACAAPW